MSAMLSAVHGPDTGAPSRGPAGMGRESLAALLLDLELRTADDFRSVAGPARRAERTARRRPASRPVPGALVQLYSRYFSASNPG
ncbi:hypothetical protein AB0C29_48795, partial [Actinoplanes sp. NPDC048791]|uniref:hypothetical protein n=1 Tax=Actinoplanes sp. NPDC048791 TaxID=3154623 RepID=UPI0033F4C635